MRINDSYKEKGALLKIQRLDILNYSLFHGLVGLMNFLIRDWLVQRGRGPVSGSELEELCNPIVLRFTIT